MDSFVEIGDVRLDGGGGGLALSKGGLRGWYDTPSLKSDIRSREGAHGAWPSRPLYSARTVTFDAAMLLDTRQERVDLFHRLNGLANEPVRVRVLDVYDTFVTGLVETLFPSGHVRDAWDFQVIVTCADPFRYATALQSVSLVAGARRGGLTYPVTYPISYGGDLGRDAAGVVSNDGNATAYPVIHVHGDLPGGFTLTDSRGRSIRYTEDVYASSPVVVDCRARTVTRLGVNVSHNLTVREWFDAAPGTELTVSFEPGADLPVGQAWADLTLRDTWI